MCNGVAFSYFLCIVGDLFVPNSKLHCEGKKKIYKIINNNGYNFFNVILIFIQRTWNFEMLELLTYTSDPIKANISGRVERAARGQSVMSGYFHLNFEIDNSIVSNIEEKEI